jgi:hypothetical protein
MRRYYRVKDSVAAKDLSIWRRKMKSHHVLFAIAAMLLAPIAGASITDWSCADDGDGLLAITAGWDGTILNLTGTQYGAPGHVLGSFTTDTELDPTVWIVESLDNDTGQPWSDYHISVTMSQSFSITGVISPMDWTWAITSPAPIPGNKWLGTVDYYAGTYIPPGGSGSFGLVVSFAGSVDFFIEEFPTYPAPAAVPAPGVLLLAALGLGCLRWVRTRESR